nr:ribonuclease H-like domain-containing protein [Tanacetum cinerariifolium]
MSPSPRQHHHHVTLTPKPPHHHHDHITTTTMSPHKRGAVGFKSDLGAFGLAKITTMVRLVWQKRTWGAFGWLFNSKECVWVSRKPTKGAFGLAGTNKGCVWVSRKPQRYPHQGFGSYATNEFKEYQNELVENGYRWNGDENQYVQQHEPIYYPAAESKEYQNEYHRVTNGGNGNQQEIHMRTIIVNKEPCAIPRHAFILWFACKKRLLTQDRMDRWNDRGELNCAFCKNQKDSHSHLFFECDYLRKWLLGSMIICLCFKHLLGNFIDGLNDYSHAQAIYGGMENRGVTILVSEPGYETVGSKDLTCEDWMVNTCTDADLSASVQNALQTLLLQIRTEIREEFRTKGRYKNGIAERKHRHLLHVVRSLMFQGEIPLRMWSDCNLTATYLINRFPSSVLSGKSPYEMIYKKCPSLSRLKVFGCL